LRDWWRHSQGRDNLPRRGPTRARLSHVPSRLGHWVAWTHADHYAPIATARTEGWVASPLLRL